MMLKKAIVLLAAVFSVGSQASLRTMDATVVYPDDVAKITFEDAGLDGICYGGACRITGDDVQSRPNVGSFSVTITRAAGPIPDYMRIGGAVSEAGFLSPWDPYLRISHSEIFFDVAAFDAATNAEIFSTSYSASSADGLFTFNRQFDLPNVLLPQSMRFDVAYRFSPGTVLTATRDSTCTSTSCMNASKRQFGNFAFIMVVPEPSTYALMGAGLAMIVAVTRRARRA